jgi:excisionase family DNA binding protein
MSQSRPLYVRLPEAEAARLDQASFALKRPKKDVVAELVRRHLIELEDDSLVVGHASSIPRPEAVVLTVEQAADLLQVDPEVVRGLAEKGDLPGREIGGEWRFAREALLAWVGAGS